jgi:hypothetical protein
MSAVDNGDRHRSSVRRSCAPLLSPRRNHPVRMGLMARAIRDDDPIADENGRQADAAKTDGAISPPSSISSTVPSRLEISAGLPRATSDPRWNRPGRQAGPSGPKIAPLAVLRHDKGTLELMVSSTRPLFHTAVLLTGARHCV